jgi:hypothetical protein
MDSICEGKGVGYCFEKNDEHKNGNSCAGQKKRAVQGQKKLKACVYF